MESKAVTIYTLSPSKMWEQYLSGEIQHSRESLCIKVPEQKFPQELITKLPLALIFNFDDRTIEFDRHRITNYEKTEDNVLALEIGEWKKVIALSFEDQQTCQRVQQDLAHQQTFNQLLQVAKQMSDNLRVKPHEQLDSPNILFFAQELKTSNQYLEYLFDSSDKVKLFVNSIKQKTGPQASDLFSPQQQRAIFDIIKKMLVNADKAMLDRWLQRDNYLILLRCLSFNHEFGDRPSDYESEFLSAVSCHNALELDHQSLSASYQLLMRVNFLIDSPTSMFIDGPALSTLQEIARSASAHILQLISQDQRNIEKLAQMTDSKPTVFLELFSQLWQMFKGVLDDANTIEVKKTFHSLFLSHRLLQKTFECMQAVSQGDLGSKECRLLQKVIEAINPMLTFRWRESQQKLVGMWKNQGLHLTLVLLGLLPKADFNLQNVIYQFARQLVEVTELRTVTSQALVSYIFNEFTYVCCSSIPDSTTQLELVVQYLIRLYRIDHIRTRRCIIRSEIMLRLLERLQSKYHLLAMLKLLRCFMQCGEEDIFFYLNKHHQEFRVLKEKYHYVKKYGKRGLVYSNFVGLIKDVPTGKTKALEFMGAVLLTQEGSE